MGTVEDVPIYDEVLEEARTRTGAFARFALEPHDSPAGPRVEEPAEEIPTEEQPAAVAEQPETEPLEQQIRTAAEEPYAPPSIRSGRPRSQR